MINFSFKSFVETFTSVDGRKDFMGHAHELPDQLLEFPTVTKTAPVISCRLVGKNYCIQLQGEATIYVECNKYHKLFGNRLPKPGEVVTAVFYKFKENDDKNYKLQKLSFS